MVAASLLMSNVRSVLSLVMRQSFVIVGMMITMFPRNLWIIPTHPLIKTLNNLRPKHLHQHPTNPSNCLLPLLNVTPFEGPDQITIGNGQGLNINSSGVSYFHSPFNSKVPLTLKILKFVPSITKILALVSSAKITQFSLNFIPIIFWSYPRFLKRCFFMDWWVMMDSTTYLTCRSPQSLTQHLYCNLVSL